VSRDTRGAGEIKHVGGLIFYEVPRISDMMAWFGEQNDSFSEKSECDKSLYPDAI
jgi:hypothetical protein